MTLDGLHLLLTYTCTYECDHCFVWGRPAGESEVRFRGRAAHTLADKATKHAWPTFDRCPYEDLRDPGRVHIDPLGYVHACQGIAIGNVFERALADICRDYNPDAHPIVGPLLRGGPAQLITDYNLAHADGYADACHLCDAARRQLRGRFPEELAPNQMYGALPPTQE